jgi:ABC-2 type transport system permease protein
MRTLHAEWTKARTLSSTAWLSLAVVVITMVVGAATTGSIDHSGCVGCSFDITKLAFTGVWFGQVAVVVLAGLSMTSEYSTKMIQTSLLANPRRAQLFAAKAAVITAIVLVAGAFAVLGSLVVARQVLDGIGLAAAPSLGDGPSLRAAAGTALYLTLIALLTLGVAAVIRDTAVSIASVLGILFALPIVAQFVSDPQWSMWLSRLSPMTAGLSVQATRGLRTLPIGPWAGLGVLAAYAGVALVVGGILFKVRDA